MFSLFVQPKNWWTKLCDTKICAGISWMIIIDNVPFRASAKEKSKAIHGCRCHHKKYNNTFLVNIYFQSTDACEPNTINATNLGRTCFLSSSQPTYQCSTSLFPKAMLQSLPYLSLRWHYGSMCHKKRTKFVLVKHAVAKPHWQIYHHQNRAELSDRF